MVRRFIAGVLIILALFLIALIVAIPVLQLTPVGNRLLALVGTPTPTPAPVLTPKGTPPALTAGSAFLLDADTGNVLANVNGDQQLPMASTTKIMTAIIALEKGDLNQIVTIKQDALDEVKKNNGSTANLVVGDQISLRDLLYGLMLPSGDDAAIAVANAVSGSPAAFVTLMNQYAQRLHLAHTHYINPDGLTYYDAQGKADPNHYTTANDLAHLTRYALSNSFFEQIVQLQQYNLAPTSNHHAYQWKTTNTLLSSYPGLTGVKTGFTVEADYCLVFSGTNGGHHLIGVVMKEKDENQRFVDAKALLEWGFKLPLQPPVPTPEP